VHAVAGGISIDLRRMHRVLRVSAEDLDATVEASTSDSCTARSIPTTG
jgi:FAD/FMN-containing dehydrogenase